MIEWSKVFVYGILLFVFLVHMDEVVLPNTANKILSILRGITLYIVTPFVIGVMVLMFISIFDSNVASNFSRNMGAAYWAGPIAWVRSNVKRLNS